MSRRNARLARVAFDQQAKIARALADAQRIVEQPDVAELVRTRLERLDTCEVAAVAASSLAVLTARQAGTVTAPTRAALVAVGSWLARIVARREA